MSKLSVAFTILLLLCVCSNTKKLKQIPSVSSDSTVYYSSPYSTNLNSTTMSRYRSYGNGIRKLEAAAKLSERIHTKT